MKKFLLTLTIALTFGYANAQRQIDWSVEEIIKPTEIRSSFIGGVPLTTINVDVALKNNGIDDVLVGDSLYCYLFVVRTSDNVILIQGPYRKVLTEDVIADDTIHVTFTASAPIAYNNSQNVKFIFQSLVSNTKNQLQPEFNTNNELSKAMIYYNPNGFGVSVKNIENASNLTVYPNPASDVVTIACENVLLNVEKSVNVYDMTGKLVYSNKTTGFDAEFTINTSTFEAGIYTVQFNSGDRISTSKFTVVK